MLGTCRQSEVAAGVLAHKLRKENVSLALAECLIGKMKSKIIYCMHLFAIFTYWQDSTSSTHKRHENYSTYKMLIIKERDQYGDLDLDRSVRLKWILQKRSTEVIAI